MTCIEQINLVGTGLGADLGELEESLKRPCIKKIDIPYSGIEQNVFCTYFKHVFNPDSL